MTDLTDDEVRRLLNDSKRRENEVTFDYTPQDGETPPELRLKFWKAQDAQQVNSIHGDRAERLWDEIQRIKNEFGGARP